MLEEFAGGVPADAGDFLLELADAGLEGVLSDDSFEGGLAELKDVLAEPIVLDLFGNQILHRNLLLLP